MGHGKGMGSQGSEKASDAKIAERLGIATQGCSSLAQSPTKLWEDLPCFYQTEKCMEKAVRKGVQTTSQL